MRVFSWLAVFLAGWSAGVLHAQTAAPVAARAPAGAAAQAAPVVTQGSTPALPSVVPPVPGAERPPWRQLNGYAFPALADTVSSMQNMSYAMQLRDYCADGRIEDDFVRDRLARFSRMTGREEDCSTLLRY